MDLFEWAKTHRQERRPETIAERFARFNSDNPHVYALLRRFALEARAAGRRRLGIALLVERARWESAIVTKGDLFKLNNDYRSRYVRLLTEQEPTLATMFETRRLRSD